MWFRKPFRMDPRPQVPYDPQRPRSSHEEGRTMNDQVTKGRDWAQELQTVAGSTDSEGHSHRCGPLFRNY
jgi:hypothetical protein